MASIYGNIAAPPKKQKGIVMPIVAIGLLSMLGMVGLALDFGHAMTNRARLQNSLDATAIGAAKALSDTNSQTAAEDAGRQIFTDNIQATGNSELLDGGASANDLIFEFSQTVKPFVPDPNATSFVRVRMTTNISFATWLMSLFGQNNLSINSSAVAGVSPTLGEICNIAPFIICGNPDDEDFGLEEQYPDTYPNIIVKRDSNTSEIGPGNFQLARLNPDDAGGADVRENLAGTYGGCIESGQTTVDTEPGNTVGPVAQGLNTRFGMYSGPVSRDDYPPDKVTSHGENYNHSSYMTDYSNENFNEADGLPGRRVMAVPVADCTAFNTGQSTLDLLGNMCMFLTEPAGKTGNTQEIYMEVIEGCNVTGVAGPDPTNSSGPTKIILYGDADRWDT